MILSVGDKLNNFELDGIDADGNEKKFLFDEILKENKNIVIYFYPKDDTPGCTQEACDFRDNFNRIISKAFVFGVSADSIQSHKKFQQKHSLNFALLSDPEHILMEQFGAWGEKSMYGKKYLGVIRSTFIIGKDGIIKKAWPTVKVKGHVNEVLKELE